MARQARPGIDRALEPRHGVSRDGQPMSYNRAPAADLAPWIGRLYFTAVKAPADYRLACGLFNDTAFIRIQLAGEWTAETADGPRAYGRSSLFFGPNSKRMPITVTGSFVSLGISIRPGACQALGGPKVADFVDRLVDCKDVGIISPGFIDLLDGRWRSRSSFAGDRGLAARAGGAVRMAASPIRSPPDSKRCPLPIPAPASPISRANAASTSGGWNGWCGAISAWRPSRCCAAPARSTWPASCAASPMRPRLTRLALRYYDQSHLIHEFTELFGMSPRQFVETPQPILTLALESRQARRLEAIARLAPGATRPWEEVGWLGALACGPRNIVAADDSILSQGRAGNAPQKYFFTDSL